MADVVVVDADAMSPIVERSARAGPQRCQAAFLLCRC